MKEAILLESIDELGELPRGPNPFRLTVRFPEFQNVMFLRTRLFLSVRNGCS